MIKRGKNENIISENNSKNFYGKVGRNTDTEICQVSESNMGER